MATVRIPTPLRPFTGGNEEVTLAGATVAELVATLKSDLPDLAGRILDADGNVRRFINLYVDDTDIRTLDGTDTALTDASVVAIVPAIAGGR
jgi:molybdopterin converting factor small subunit